MNRALISTAVAAATLIALMVWRLIGGDPAPDLAAAFAGIEPERAILLHFRGPRLILALATGAALGMSGTVLQVMLRNPLASPDIIGFGAGASTGAAVGIVIFGDIAAAMPGALAGGALAALLVMSLAWRDGVSPLALILVGVSLTLILTTATDILLSLSPGVLATETTRFLTGSFASADWRTAGIMSVTALIGAGVLAAYAVAVDRLEHGDDVAITLGLEPNRVRLAVTACATGLVAISVAVAGPVPFIAFLAGPIARLAAGRPGTVLGLAALVGATLALGADALAGLPVAGTRLPAGIYTALIGAPAMLALLLRLEVDRK